MNDVIQYVQPNKSFTTAQERWIPSKYAATLIVIASYLELIQNRFIYNNIRSDTHGCGSSRIENKHSIQELSIACSLYIREHPAYESAPTSTHNVSLNLCATDNPNLAEFRYSSAKEGQGANRGAGSARTGVVHDLSLNDAKPPVKMQLSTHHNSLRRITRY